MIGILVEGHRGHRFTVVREIGRGGFGVVFLAEDDEGRKYAMKLLAPLDDPIVQRSFAQEIESTTGLQHENLLSVVDYGTVITTDGQGFFAVTEFCPDGDYRQRLAAYGRKATEVLLVADFRQILAGLGVLHSRIVHRDLKPENVLVSGGTLKIGDYGLAKFVDEATRTISFKGGGTPRYMAPEVWLGRTSTPATDLYSVGVMLFEAVTGRQPFEAADVNELRELHLYSQAPRAKSVNPTISDPLDGVIRKLLSKEPQHRYGTAAAVIEALQVVPASGEPAIVEIAARMRDYHDVAEVQRMELEREVQARRDSVARNRLKEQELIELVDQVVDEINLHLAETKIDKHSGRNGKEYRFGNRVLVLHFFQDGELYEKPVVPGRMQTLHDRYAVHGGYIEVRENGEDREGWNLVLIRSPDTVYGEWRIVESRVSALARHTTRYEPVATNAQLLADNLACHWVHAMHVWDLTDKVLERTDILRIIECFVPAS